MTILLPLAVLASLVHPVEDVTLARTFKVGDKAAYQVRSNLHSEMRQLGLNTFLPSEIDLNYDFTTQVTELKGDGNAVMIYKRPTMTQIDGETAERPPKSTTEKVNMDLTLTISIINEILQQVDNKKPEPKKNKPKLFITAPFGHAPQQLDLGSFIGEIHRLALFVGSLDSALDFNPKLPYDEVKVGDTWKRTVGYSPQKLQGENKAANQKLDYVYKYEGEADRDGKKVHKISVTLSLDTDVAEFVNQFFRGKEAATGLKACKLKLDSKIDFFLDQVTCQTLAADATSKGSIEIMAVGEDQPVYEERMDGETTLRLVKK